MKASLSKMKKQVQRGFTLVEIAIVLVIIGLLIGGVLRGQELLNSARVNSIASQQSSISTAYYGFIDRYKTMPGDLSGTQALLINNLTAPASVSGDGDVLLADSAAFFNNLAQAGFITCTPCSATGTGGIVTAGTGGAAATYAPPTTLSGTNTMVNVYGTPLTFRKSTAIVGGLTAGSIDFLTTTVGEISKPMLTTGNTITSVMLAEMDRKADDGNPSGGSFRYTDNGTGVVAGDKVGATPSAACFAGSAAAGFTWLVNPPGSCQGATLF
jgi:prepilin-type N-terminal cleavage/methylation domain-containing protein